VCVLFSNVFCFGVVRFWNLEFGFRSYNYIFSFLFIFFFSLHLFSLSLFFFFLLGFFPLPPIFCLVVILPSCCALCYLELLPCYLVLLLLFVALLHYLIPLPHCVASSHCLFTLLPYIASLFSHVNLHATSLFHHFVMLLCCFFTSLPSLPHFIAITRCFAYYHRSLPQLATIAHCLVHYHRLLPCLLLSLPHFIALVKCLFRMSFIKFFINVHNIHKRKQFIKKTLSLYIFVILMREK